MPHLISDRKFSPLRLPLSLPRPPAQGSACVPPRCCSKQHGSENPGVKGIPSVDPGVAQHKYVLPHLISDRKLSPLRLPLSLPRPPAQGSACVPPRCCYQQHGSENLGVKEMVRLTPGLRSTQGTEFFEEKFGGAQREGAKAITSRCDTPPPGTHLHLSIPVHCKSTVSQSKRNENHDK